MASIASAATSSTKGNDSMKRLRFTGKPGASALTIEQATLPPPSPGRVLVAVQAVCLLPNDISKLGCALSGTVLFVGRAPLADTAASHVTWQAGDKVWGRLDGGGALAEIVSMPSYTLRKMKTDKTFAESATLAGPGLLACRALQLAELTREGKPRVLVHGGQTALGTFVIQVAKVMKCDVEVTILPADIATKANCRDLGADDFVDLQDEIPFGKTLASFRGRWERNFSAVVDCLGDDTSLYDKMASYTREEAKFLTVKPQSISWKSVLLKRITGSPREYVTLDASVSEQDAQKQFELVARCVDSPDFVDIEIQDTLRFEEADRAIQRVQAYTGFGAIIVEVMPANDGTLEAWLKQYQEFATGLVQAGYNFVLTPQMGSQTVKSRRSSAASSRRSFGRSRSAGFAVGDAGGA